jgi:hypothetical protein
MTWQEIGEIIKVLGAVATAGAAWFAASIAYKGLEKWRNETSGKQRAELAAIVLANVYQMAEILRNARELWMLPQEKSKLEGVPDEITANWNFVPERRLLAHQEFFGRFRSIKHEFASVFGADSASFFDALWKIRIDINHAVHSMVQNKELGSSRDPEHMKLWREWYHVAFISPDEAKDEVLKKINAQVAKAESICKPAIEVRAGV